MLDNIDFKSYSLIEIGSDLNKYIDEEEIEEVKEELILAKNHIVKAILLLKDKKPERDVL